MGRKMQIGSLTASSISNRPAYLLRRVGKIWNRRVTAASVETSMHGGQSEAFGYKPGRLFDPGALRMGLATKQSLPWYSVIGPGTPIQRQPPGTQLGVAQVMTTKSVPTYSPYGPGVAAGETLQQLLLNPPNASQAPGN